MVCFLSLTDDEAESRKSELKFVEVLLLLLLLKISNFDIARVV